MDVTRIAITSWERTAHKGGAVRKRLDESEVPSHLAPGGTCAACGAALPEVSGQAMNGALLLSTLPPMMAAALRLVPTLSPREHTVLQSLSFGYDNRTIAKELKISEPTVKRHVTAILSKLHLESRLQAGLIALTISSSAPTGTSGSGGRS
jgi:DNA-binding NarL/FixJ family response regulator